jgi:hypothetical protein
LEVPQNGIFGQERRRSHRLKPAITAAAARIGRKRLKTTCFGTRRGLSLLGTDFPSPTAGRYVYTINVPAPRHSAPVYLQTVSEAVF